MSNVINFKSQTKNQTAHEFMSLVRDALYEYGDMKRLSNHTDISVNCLYAIRSGRTKWPRWTTLQLMMKPLGLELTLRRIAPIDKFVDTSNLRDIFEGN
jgi:DNA-binding phage protein